MNSLVTYFVTYVLDIGGGRAIVQVQFQHGHLTFKITSGVSLIKLLGAYLGD